MHALTLVVVLLSLLWGVGSGWWYTCKIKGFCGDPTTPAAAPATTPPAPSPAVVPSAPPDLSPLAFDSASEVPRLTPADRDRLAVIVLRLGPGATLTLTGHTDDRGSTPYNERLGLRRAEAVQAELVRVGAPTDRITARSEGETRPLAPNDSDEGRGRNRRVEFAIDEKR